MKLELVIKVLVLVLKYFQKYSNPTLEPMKFNVQFLCDNHIRFGVLYEGCTTVSVTVDI